MFLHVYLAPQRVIGFTKSEDECPQVFLLDFTEGKITAILMLYNQALIQYQVDWNNRSNV